MAPLSPAPSMLDADQCIREAFDDNSDSLKVTIVGDAIPSGGGIEVSISSTNDSIAIGNTAGVLANVDSNGDLYVANQNTLITLPYNSIYPSYPNATTEIYVYKNGPSTVGTVTVLYVDSSKNEIVSIIKT